MKTFLGLAMDSMSFHGFHGSFIKQAEKQYLLNSYLQQMPLDLAELHKAGLEGHLDTVRFIARKCCLSSEACGADEMAALIHMFENFALIHDAEDMEDVLVRIRLEFDHLHQFLKNRRRGMHFA